MGAVPRKARRPKLMPEDAAAEVRQAGYEPLEPYPGRTNSPWRCRCLTCGEVTETVRINALRLGGRCCKTCGYRALAAKNLIDRPEALVVMKAAGLVPLVSFPGLNVPWACRCERCGAETKPRYGNILKGSGGCKTCGYAALSAIHRGDAEAAEADMRSAGFEPLAPYKSIRTPWRSRCVSCGNEVAPRLEAVRLGKAGCRWCAGRRLSEEDAIKLMDERGLTPLAPYTNLTAEWRFRCQKCGRDGLTRLAHVRGGSAGCLWCAGQKIEADDAVAWMRSRGFEPLQPYPGSSKPWKCRCVQCERVVFPQHSNSGGCKYCAKIGFNLTAPAVVYLIRHDALFALKVGVTSEAARTDRLAAHIAMGWVPLRSWRFPTGEAAMKIELAVLRWWREDIGAPAGVASSDMPQSGHSETISMRWMDEERAIGWVEGILARDPTSSLGIADDTTT